MAHYEGGKGHGNRRQERAKQMNDETYVPEQPATKNDLVLGRAVPAQGQDPEARPSPQAEELRAAMSSFGEARHLDCAPTHIQEAVARAKRGEHLKVPRSE